jgi:hypothetical protein
LLMAKKAKIIIALVNECEAKSNSQLEKEIFEELSKRPARIPWMKRVLKVEVTTD